MPCGCFGKNKKKAKEEEEAIKKVAPNEATTGPPSDLKAKPDDDASKTAKRRDVVASYYEDECALLGYRPTGSRPSSSCVDSPTNNSHTHTPSTVPVMASSTSSQTSSGGSSPLSPRTGASSRAELEEKRREFFKDFLPNDRSSHQRTNLPSTLPTVARARQFGKVRPMRPVSQPMTPSDGPSSVPEAPPPGPHLLRPVSGSRGPTKIDANAHELEGGFTSPEFLRELKDASDQISRRWAMCEDEFDESGSSGLKMREVTYKSSDDDDAEEDAIHAGFTSNIPNSNIDNAKNYSHSLTYSVNSTIETISPSPAHPPIVPETLITPPSPPSVEYEEEEEEYGINERPPSSNSDQEYEDYVKSYEQTASFGQFSEETRLLKDTQDAQEEEDEEYDALIRESPLQENYDFTDEPVVEPEREKSLRDTLADTSSGPSETPSDTRREPISSETSPSGEDNFILERNLDSSNAEPLDSGTNNSFIYNVTTSSN